MEFYDVLRQRRSFRGYVEKEIPSDVLNRIGEAVNLAPTACNKQPFKLLLIRNAELRKKICDSVSHFAWLAEAPVIAVMLGNEDDAWHRREGDSAANIDCAIAMEHFVLAAAAENLGTCWVCAYERAALDAVLPLENGWRSVAISPLGYVKKDSVRPFARKELNRIMQVID